MTGMPRSRAAARIGSISAVWPYRWTGMIAAVFRVITDATFAGSMLYDDRAMSTKTSFAPDTRTVDAAVKNARSGVATAPIGATSSAGGAATFQAGPTALAKRSVRRRA